MFLRYFNLQEQPFGVTPDPRYLYMSRGHREALSSLIYGIESERGFLAMIAPPGMGKTTLLFQLLERLRNQARTAFLFNTQCDSHQLLGHLLADLGVDFTAGDMVKVHEQLNAILLRSNRDGKRCVFIIDEAQNLDREVLETVRLLSNFETPRSKLLQIIVAGQPALAETLADPKLLQFRQRIGLLARLRALNRKETAKYVRHRLRIAGYEGPDIFTPEALQALARHSEGVPRLINSIAFNAMSLAYATDRRSISAALVEEAAQDVNLLAQWPPNAFVAEEEVNDDEPDGGDEPHIAVAPPAVLPLPAAKSKHSPVFKPVAKQVPAAEPQARPEEVSIPVPQVPAAESVSLAEGSEPAGQSAASIPEAEESRSEPSIWQRLASAVSRLEMRAVIALGTAGALLLTLAPIQMATLAQPSELAAPEEATTAEAVPSPTTATIEDKPAALAPEAGPRQEKARTAAPATFIASAPLSADTRPERAPALELQPDHARALSWLTAVPPRTPRRADIQETSKATSTAEAAQND